MSFSYPKKAYQLVSNTTIVNENAELEDELNLETDLEDIINESLFDQKNFESSFLSKPFFTFDMAEPRLVNSKFVYNYFEKKERAYVSPDIDATFTQAELDNTSDILFKKNNSNLPKMIELNIYGPSNVNYANPSLIVREMSEDELKSKINVEAANSTPFYSGFELFDVDIEKFAYDNILDNLFISSSNNLSQFSHEGYANMLANSLNSSTLFNTSAKELINKVINIKNSGYGIASNDVKPENVDIFKRNKIFSGLNFSIKCANLFFSDVYSKAIRQGNSVFESENRAIKIVAESKTNNLISQYSSTLGSTIQDIEFDVEVDSIETFSNSGALTQAGENYKINHIGYYVLKEETTDDGIPIKFKPIIKITDKENINIIDPNVRYGGFYTYIVRSIYEVIAPAYDPADGGVYRYEKFLLASEGIPTVVNCIETTAPPPPAAIRGSIDFKYKVPRITWQFPVNPQRDIKRFQVFKRESQGLPFTLVAEYNFDDSIDPTSVTEIAQPKNLYKLKFPRLMYTDYKYISNSAPIYAIASVDAHGLTSNLSTQISVKYNKMQNKPEVNLISREGAPKPYPNIYIESDTFLDAINSSNMDRMTVFFDPDCFALNKKVEAMMYNSALGHSVKVEHLYDLNMLSINPEQSTYKIQIINLDTTKTKEINIKIKDAHSNNLNESQKISDFNAENLTFT